MNPVLSASAALFLGSFVQGASGFAFSLVSLPLLMLVIPQREAVPLLTMMGLLINSVVLFSAGRRADPRRFLPLLAAGVAGTLPGILLLQTLPERPLRIAVGITISLAAAAYAAGARARIRNEKAAMIPVGLLSGLLNGLMTFGGPPVIVFLANQDAGKEEFRAGLSFYFLGLNILSLPLLAARGLLGSAALAQAAPLLPSVLAGSALGAALSRRIPEVAFRRIVLALLAILGISSTAAAF